MRHRPNKLLACVKSAPEPFSVLSLAPMTGQDKGAIGVSLRRYLARGWIECAGEQKCDSPTPAKVYRRTGRFGDLTTVRVEEVPVEMSAVERAWREFRETINIQ